MSPKVVRDLAINWGYEYITASSKSEFDSVYKRFVSPTITDRPILFEVFTKVEDENEALLKVENFGTEVSKGTIIKQCIKNAIGEKGTHFIKKITKS